MTTITRSLSALCTLALAATLLPRTAAAEPIHAFQRQADGGIGHWIFHPKPTYVGRAGLQFYSPSLPPVDTSQGDTFSLANGLVVSVGAGTSGSIVTNALAASETSCAFYDAVNGGRQMVVNYFRDATHLDDSWSSDGVNFGAGSWDPPSGGVMEDGTPIMEYQTMPATAAREQGRIDMFAMAGFYPDSLELIHRSWTHAGGTNWRHFVTDDVLRDRNYHPVGPPVAISWRLNGADRVDVFWTARGDDGGSLVHAWTTPDLESIGGWESWGNGTNADLDFWGGSLAWVPAVVSPRENQIDVYQVAYGSYGTTFGSGTPIDTIIRWSWNNGTLTTTYLNPNQGTFGPPSAPGALWLSDVNKPYYAPLTMALFQLGGTKPGDAVDYWYWMAGSNILNSVGEPFSLLVAHEVTPLGFPSSGGNQVTLCSEPLY
jgi:hypothetical protein